MTALQMKMYLNFLRMWDESVIAISELLVATYTQLVVPSEARTDEAISCRYPNLEVFFLPNLGN